MTRLSYFLTLVLALLLTCTANAQLTRLAVDNGFYQSGLHNPLNMNYFTGQITGTQTHSFFVFDVPDAGGSISSAMLRIPTYDVVTADAFESLGVFDVTTDLGALLDGTGGLAAYDDLASGVAFGAADIPGTKPPTFIEVPLNAEAIHQINNGSGAFALGAALTSIDGPDDQYAFAFSRTGVPELVLDAPSNPGQSYQTAFHSVPSFLNLSIFLGDPNDGGVAIDTIENIPLHGSLSATPLINSDNSGVLLIEGSQMVLETLQDVTIDLKEFGSVTLDLEGVTVDVMSGLIPVTNGQFSIDGAEFFELAINQGIANLDDPTGVIAALAPPGTFPVFNNFATSPVVIEFDDLIGLAVR
ncbi:MAG: hypothetical protein RIC12_00765 [Pirellulales bacterium]